MSTGQVVNIAGASVCVLCQQVRWLMLLVHPCFMSTGQVVSVAGASVCALCQQIGWLMLLVHLSVLHVNRSGG